MGDEQHGGGRVEVTFASQTGRVPVSLEVEVTRDHYQATESSQAAVNVTGFGTVDCPTSAGGPTCTVTIPTWVDAGGLTVTLTSNARTAGGLGGLSGPGWATQVSSSARVTVRRRAGTEAYGTACGLTLSSVPNPNLVDDAPIEIVDQTFATPFGVLLVGTQQIVFTLPISPCPIRNEAFAAVPLVFASSRSAFTLAELPTPGVFTLQAVTFTGSTLHTSNGLQF